MSTQAFETKPIIEPGTSKIHDCSTRNHLAAVAGGAQTCPVIDRDAVVHAISNLQVAGMNRDPHAQRNVSRPVCLTQQLL
jgi:hypothetical protein